MRAILPAKQLHEAFYALGILKHIPGGPHHAYFPPIEPASRDHFDQIEDLVSRMPWIRTVQRGFPTLMQFGLDLRPYMHGQDNRSMLAKMRYYCGQYDAKPWFDRMQAARPHVVLARGLRQQNPFFPWGPLLSMLRKLPLRFVGTDEEFAAFQPCIPEGVSVEPVTLDWSEEALDVCLSAALFVGSHTLAQAVCEGAEVPSIAEVSLGNPDNVFVRPGSYPCFSQRAEIPMEVPFYGGAGVQAPISGVLSEVYTDWPLPPEGWKVQIPGRGTRYFEHLDEACFHLCRKSEDIGTMQRQYARALILRAHLEEYPEWAEKALAARLFRKPALALQAASRKISLREYLPPVSSYLSDLCD